jgi:preprotein translocase subunit Sec63
VRLFRWLILIGCFVIGYLLVSRLMAPKPNVALGDAERVTMSNWFVILGVRENASFDEIKSAYRHAISQVHPDKFANASESERARAEAKAKQINAAYELGARLFQS